MENQLSLLKLEDHGVEDCKKKPTKKKKMVPKGTRKRNQEILEAQCVEHLKQYFDSLTMTGQTSVNKIRFRTYSIHDFEIYCLLGSGGFGKVNNCFK